MKTKLAVLILLVAVAVADAQTNNLTTLLQQGLLEEQANRNLDAAIADYQALAAQFDKDRQLAATAIFRLGECYRMQGKTNEAALQYQKILRDFSDQTSLSTLSRQDLAGLSVPPSAAAPSDNSTAALWDRVKDLPQDQLEKVLPTLAPDPVLTSLLQQRNEAETKLAELQINHGPQTPEIMGQKAALAAIDKQISEKISGIIEALKLRAALSQAPVAASPPADDEDQEIARLQQMIQDSPDLLNAPGSSSVPPLVQAAISDHLRVAQFLVDKHADVNVKTGNGDTPLTIAALRGHKAMVELLLSHGADVNEKGSRDRTALYEAAMQGFRSVVEMLLAHHADLNARDDEGITPLGIAAGSGRTAIVQMLLAAGANPNVEYNDGQTPLSFAAGRGSPEIVKLLLAAKADPGGSKLDAPLLCAIHQQAVESAQFLLEAGANPNAIGAVDWQPHSWNYHIENSQWRASASPLWLAVDMDQLPMVQLLLKFKADPNDTQIGNESLLYFALDKTNILEALLEAGAKPDEPGNNINPRTTPLEYAAKAGNAAAVELLLRHGADPNYRDANGETPLHYAASTQALSHNVFELLLNDHANPNVRNRNGETPLDYLKDRVAFPGPTLQLQRTASQLADFLRQHGARDVLPHWDRITASRPSAHYSAAIFYKGTNEWNQFTLYDLIGVQYKLLTADPAAEVRVRSQPQINYVGDYLTFPDFRRIIIHRPSASETNWHDVNIDLGRALASGNCAGDVPLQFGDVVEIPEADHVIHELWPGLTTNELFTLKNCLTRHLQITVNGQTTNLTVAPQVEPITAGDSRHIPAGFGGDVTLLEFEPFMLWPVLEHSSLVRASSDLSRVTVKRRDPATGQTREWTVDCSNPTRPNFWLRDGDRIDVPEKK